MNIRDALDALLAHYIELVNSGDAGHWDPEREAVVINARAALAAPPPPMVVNLAKDDLDKLAKAGPGALAFVTEPRTMGEIVLEATDGKFDNLTDLLAHCREITGQSAR